MKAAAFIEKLEAGGLPCAVLRDANGGCAVFLEAGARLIGLWPDPEGPNLLWTHPDLTGDPAKAALGWAGLTPGGPGGDRLWHGPEHRFFWDGAPKPDLSNHRVPAAFDPGKAQMTSDDHTVEFRHSLSLPDGASARIKRRFTLELSEAPGHLRLREEQELELIDPRPDSELDLWVIVQVPASSCLILPLRDEAQPQVAYEANPGDIARLGEIGEGCFRWRFTGEPMLKGHFPVDAVTGTLGCVRRIAEDRFSLLTRRFTPRPDQPYRDGLLPEQVGAQCVQFWDGLGYGEIECHSPTATAENPTIRETHVIEARVGSQQTLSQHPYLIRQEQIEPCF